jgi:hypothetical protein
LAERQTRAEELVQLLLLEEYAPLSNARKSNLINIPLEKNNDKSKNGKLLRNVMFQMQDHLLIKQMNWN